MNTVSFIGNVLKIDFANSRTPKLIIVNRVEANLNGTALDFFTGNKVVDSLPFANCSLDGATAFVSLAAFHAWVESSLGSLVTTVGGRTQKALDSFVTATGATAYTANDVINEAANPVLRQINVGCNSGYITDLVVEMEVTAGLVVPAILPILRIKFYDSPHASLNVADNDPDEITFSNYVRRIGYVDMPAMVSDVAGGVGRIMTQLSDLRKAFSNLTGNILYYKIVILNGSTLGAVGLGRQVVVRKMIEKN